MKCPHCHTIPMNFALFLVIGWIHIRCRNCSTRLVLKSVGERFWRSMAAGAVVIATVYFYVDYPLRFVGERGTVVAFVLLIASTMVLSMYFAWKDSVFRISEQH